MVCRIRCPCLGRYPPFPGKFGLCTLFHKPLWAEASKEKGGNTLEKARVMDSNELQVNMAERLAGKKATRLHPAADSEAF